ncbi:MAG TPA: NAD(P)-dependent oxidoreductase [Vicinamibacterales bacterium]|nr:NAD(P)-dependent oxidoreductase [Vicinamibacterales bacterium]
MRIAVTGASGFIGRNLVAHLTARGDEVVPIRRPFDATRLAAELRGAAAAVHLAGLVSAVRENEFVEANVDSTRIVAQAARDAGVRLVHLSSLAAAGPAAATTPRSEGDPPRPITAYGRSKLAGERTLHETPGLRWIALRPGVVYGPHDRALLPLFRMAARGFLPLVGRAGAAYTLIHVTDLMRAIVPAIETDLAGEPIFIGHPSPAGPLAIVDAIRAAVAPHARTIRVPMVATRLAAAAGEIAQRVTGRPAPINRSRYRELAAEGFVCRVDRMRERLGVVAGIGLHEGIARTADWYRGAGWLAEGSGPRAQG